MKKKIFKWTLSILVLLFASTFLMIVFSPYKKHNGFNQKMVVVSVVIDVPAEQVYQYLGNSDNASNWSSYVDHISSLNANKYNDGEVGSKRRCFKNKNETGITWDEEILINETNTRRRLSIFNMKKFPVNANHLLTEQRYKALSTNRCELTFTLFFDSGKSSLLSELKMYAAAYRVSSIFKANLENIKSLNES